MRRPPVVTSFLAVAAGAFGLLGCGALPAGAAVHRVVPLRPTSAQYLAEINADASEIASHLGHSLSLPEHVVINKKQEFGNIPAYSYAYDSSNEMSGAPSYCTTFINPSFNSEDAEYQKLALIHETFHCFQALDYSSLTAYYAAPKWLIEGEAEWVGATLAPTELNVWNDYLTDIDTSLFSRSYDAIGFYAHMTNSGEDTWHLLDPMLRAGSSPAAYNVAADNEVRLTWASSLARQPSLGQGWQTTGPGITSATYHPSVDSIADGTKVTDTVDPYTNDVIRFTVTSAEIVDVTVSTKYSRLHTSNGTEYDNLTSGPAAFCVKDCDMCPQVQDLPKLPAGGTNWLAVTGDAAGATYTVAGAKATCAPCLVGNWTVTNLSLTTDPGGTHSGGAGTTVDIQDNGDAVGDFSPGAPLVSGSGSVKFGGVITDHYSFSPTTTARSGPITASPVSSTGTITVGGQTVPIAPEVESGSYACTGNDLTLTFNSSGGTLMYDLVPAA
jgi:hypothetical protein